MADLVLTGRQGPLLRVTVNRPEVRNALSRATLAAIATAFRHYAADPGLCACILRGAGEKSFAAGGDLKELGGVRSLAEATRMAEDAKAALDAIREMPVPVVAALNGDALGGGAELALACDFRVAAAHARLGFIQGRLNISTGWGGGIDLIRRIGPSVALRLLARAELLAADEARQLGLVDEVAQEGEALDEAVERFMAPILAQKPQVLRAFKAVVRSRSAEVETERFVETWVHEDHWAAVEAILSRKRS
jgi:enoyl-CoA hydratase